MKRPVSKFTDRQLIQSWYINQITDKVSNLNADLSDKEKNYIKKVGAELNEKFGVLGMIEFVCDLLYIENQRTVENLWEGIGKFTRF